MMSVKVASITSATAKARDARKDIAAWMDDEGLCGACGPRRHESTKKKPLIVFRVFVFSWLHSSSLLQEQTAERRDHQADRLVEAVRGNRLAAHANAVADLAPAVDRGVPVDELSVPPRVGHPAAVIAPLHAVQVWDCHHEIVPEA